MHLNSINLSIVEGVYTPSFDVFFITAKPLKVLRLNFGPVNKVLLGIILSQVHTPL